MPLQTSSRSGGMRFIRKDLEISVKMVTIQPKFQPIPLAESFWKNLVGI
jgi:hypothetical protein